MKVIHVDTGREWRGGQSQVWMLSAGLRAAGCESVIVAKRGSALAERALQEGAPSKQLPFRFEADVASAIQLKKMAADGRRVIVHTHTPHALGIALIARGLGLSRPIVFTRRVSFPIKRSYLNRWKINQADRIIAVSQAVAAELLSAGIDASKTQIVHSAFDPAAFPYHGPAKGAAIHVAVLGSLEKAKGMQDALVVREKLRDTAVVLHFFGGGSDAQALQRAAASDEGIRFHGFLKDVSGFFQQMHAALSLSRSEGFPNLVLQAMATGLPVVAWKNPAVCEMLTSGESGFVVESTQEMADRIKQLAQDPEFAEKLGHAASQFVHSRFTVERMVRETLELYRKIEVRKVI